MAALVLFLLLSFLGVSSSEISSKIGINYGRIGDNLPSAIRSVELIKSMNIGRVKLYDANPEILGLLSGTNISVSIMVPNNEITGIASNQSTSDEWVKNNVLPYYPKTMIRYLLVGNEILSYISDQDRLLWHDLVPAMKKLKSSLKAQNITNIKIGAPLAMDVVQTSFPPSSGLFRPDISDTVMVPLLRFLNRTKSYFFIDVYPFFPWSSNPNGISLDFALLKSNLNNIDQQYTDTETGLVYTNLLDQMLDSLIFAMTRLGYPNIRLVIAETGWPNSGGEGANVQNAATYNRNLVRRIVSKPTVGTPARPGVVVPTFIFSLFDENQKGGPGTERHWGLLHADGTRVYDIDLTGKRQADDYAPVPERKRFVKGIDYDI